MLNEAINHILEAELIRTRKMGKADKAIKLSPGVISRNFSSLAQMIPGTAGKFKAFANAVRGLFGLSTTRALVMQKAIRDGTLDAAGYQAFIDKVTGRDYQAEHNAMAQEEQAAIGVDAPFSLARSNSARDSRLIQPLVIASAPLAGGKKDWHKAVRSYIEEHLIGRTLINKDSGGEITFTHGSKREAASKLRKESAFRAAHEIETITEDSIYLGWDDPEKGKETTHERVDYFAFPVIVDGKDCVAWFNALTPKNDTVAVFHEFGLFAPQKSPELPKDSIQQGFPQESSFKSGAGITVGQFLAEVKKSLPAAIKLQKDSPYSLAPSRMVAGIEMNAMGMIRNPLKRLQAFQRLSGKLQGLRLAYERLELLAGAKRRKTSLKKEAAMREAIRTQELVEDAMKRHEAVMSDADILKLKQQPVHQYLADPDSPLRGRVMSKSAALKKHPDMFQVNRPGEYDGAEGISRAVFGGQLMPDQAAQELFENYLIKEPTADAMWDAIRREQAFVDGMKEAMAKGLEAVAQAKAQAKSETNAWLEEQGANQEANFSDKQEILRALATLDAVLSIAPPEIRGKLGGYTQLARLGSNERRMAFLKDRLAKVDAEMEAWLKRVYHAEFMDLLKRAKPSKDAPGEKPTGKLGADIHDLFREVEAAMRMTSTEADAEATKQETMAASGDYPADREAHMQTLAGLIRLVGAWYPSHSLYTNPATGAESYVQSYPGADAARMEEALIEAARVFENGYGEARVAQAQKREARRKTTQALGTATGKAGTKAARANQENNPLFPALRSGHRLFQRPSRQKQIPSIIHWRCATHRR